MPQRTSDRFSATAVSQEQSPTGGTPDVKFKIRLVRKQSLQKVDEIVLFIITGRACLSFHCRVMYLAAREWCFQSSPIAAYQHHLSVSLAHVFEPDSLAVSLGRSPAVAYRHVGTLSSCTPPKDYEVCLPRGRLEATWIELGPL